MSDRLELYDVTVPAGTAKATPQRTALAFDPGYLRRWQVVIPAGPSGLAGFRLDYAGQQLVPNGRGTFITGNDERVEDDVTYHFVGSQWSLVAYNTDTWDHTFHVRLYVDDINDPAANTPAVPDVLPVTINAGTVDLTPTGDVPIDLAGDVPIDLSGDVAPIDLPADTVPLDLSTDVAPLDLPADAPAVADITTAGDGTTPEATA